MTERPADFDARVLAYMPGLRALAKRYVPQEYREDLVTDTIIYALDKWQNFRPDGGMWNWLSWTMRGIVSNRAERASTKTRKGVQFVPLEDVAFMASTPPTQEDAVIAKDMLSRLPRNKGGRILLKRGLGYSLAEIGQRRRRPVSAERVRQMEVDARKAFAKKVKWDAA